ncbi:hypothetical protein BH23ACT2_BH23ACT2_07130 [soil metagenome]
MARNASEMPVDPVIVVTNPDEDCSPATLRAFIDELLSGPEPELESVGAAATIRALRDEAEG